MNCRGCQQRFLPIPDLFRKIEGDSARRVTSSMNGDKIFHTGSMKRLVVETTICEK